jgi:Family of unknown function (DUF5947)
VSTPDRTQAEVISALRRLQMRQMPEGPQPIEANCDLCGTSMPEDHRHLLQLDERSIVCVCESCWALRSGDAEYRPTGSRVVWLDELDLPNELWARLRIPIGLAFFLRTGRAGAPQSGGGVVAFYPSPAGATESELDLGVWDDLVALNPTLETLEPEAETLIVDRTSDRLRCAIAPTDEAYRLVGLVKLSWRGISGGPEVEKAVGGFFDELRERAR